LADFGDKLGKKTRMDMNLGQLAKLGFIERKVDTISEGPLLDLMMDTDVLKERIINGALADVFGKSFPIKILRKVDDDIVGDVRDEPADEIAEPATEVAGEVAAENATADVATDNAESTTENTAENTPGTGTDQE
jgi:hypothetical protein